MTAATDYVNETAAALEQQNQQPPQSSLKRRATLLFAGLICVNIAAWIWAFAIFSQQPILLGTALLAYVLGLRHAVDPDHIAAIDNVTRNLVFAGKQPLTTGLWFALGHSTIVLAACALIAILAGGADGLLTGFKPVGSVIGTLVAATFLLIIGLLNLSVFLGIWRLKQGLKKNGGLEQANADALLAKQGFLARLLRPLFRLIRAPWHMYVLGLLFGLGFDTATSIGLFSMAAMNSGETFSFATIMIFPVLFAAGMALADAADGAMMMGAYHWARKDPLRKLNYNLIVTGFSALIALGIGALQASGLIADVFAPSGFVWDILAFVQNRTDILGFAIVATFMLIWGAAVLKMRTRNIPSKST